MPNPEVAALGDSTGPYFPRDSRRPPRVAVSFSGLTHPGRVRDRNEDHFLVARLAKSMEITATSLPHDGQSPFSEEEGYLVVVADGMGGAAAGERASALAVESIEAFVQNTLKWFLHLGSREERVLFDELRESLQRADRTLFERAQSNPALYGMGTTLTMAYSVANDLYIVHAGDSRAYLYRDGQLDQITSDHTIVQALVDAGMISAEEARHHHRRHVVTNVLGGPREGVYAEIHKIEVRDGDVFLFCSDGLIEPVPDGEIARVLAEHAEPQDAARTLLQLALDGGGPENITVVVARYQVDR
jgi:serine/threonine protein phosphatase PrpC